MHERLTHSAQPTVWVRARRVWEERWLLINGRIPVSLEDKKRSLTVNVQSFYTGRIWPLEMKDGKMLVDR